MKKLALLLALVMMICAIPVMAAKSATGELIVNGDMEISGTSMDPWAGYNSGAEKSSYVAHAGINAAKFTKTTSKNPTLNQKVETFSGEVKVNMWAYTEEEGKVAGAKITFYDAGGEKIGEEYNMTPIPKNKWTEISFSVGAPYGCEMMEFGLRSWEIGVIYYDDVSVKGTASPE